MTKRRTFNGQSNVKTVLALVSGEKTSGEPGRENKIKPQLLSDAHLVFERSGSIA